MNRLTSLAVVLFHLFLFVSSVSAQEYYDLANVDRRKEFVLPPLINGERVINNKEWILHYPRDYESRVPIEEATEVLEASVAKVNLLLGGRFKKPFHVFIVDEIRAGGPSGRFTGGKCFVRDGTTYVIVSLRAMTQSVLSHEIFHAKIREMGLGMDRWLEEGMAEFVETQDGFHEKHYRYIQENGVLPLSELRANRRPPLPQSFYASAWALVYNLVKVEGHSLLEIARLTHLPEPIVPVRFR